jgi:hypothetical protein
MPSRPLQPLDSHQRVGEGTLASDPHCLDMSAIVKTCPSTIGSASHVLAGRGLATCQTPPTMSPFTSPGLPSFEKV